MIPTMVSFPTDSNSFSWQCEGWILHSLDLRHAISQTKFTVSKVFKIFFDQETIIHFFVRNSFIRHLYWDNPIAKKLSVLKPLRNLESFFYFLIIILRIQQLILIKTCFNRKESLCGTNSYIVKCK